MYFIYNALQELIGVPPVGFEPVLYAFSCVLFVFVVSMFFQLLLAFLRVIFHV